MNILVLNAGSSSLKYQLIEMPTRTVQCVGNIERIGMDDAIFSHKKNDVEYKKTLAIKSHKHGLQLIEKTLLDSQQGVINSVNEITAVGHRVVHGGDEFTETVLINEKVKNSIRDLFDLAPLHNPANLTGIEVSETVFPLARQIAVFDTAFHQTMPIEAYQYAIPNEYLEKHKIRAYGFHGTSHKYVSEIAFEYLKNQASRMITIHLGNGCSMSAIKNGKSIENSLGFGPMNGLIMGTRSGDIDQSVIFYLKNKLGKSMDEINELLQRESGMKGLTGYSDLREIQAGADKGDENCKNALVLASYRIKKYIGSYTALLNGVDAVIFTAGVGENSDLIRKMSCENMDALGIVLDLDKNSIQSKGIREIQAEDSKVKILVVPTNEEIEIAQQSYALLNAEY
jgi:acetate kinase